MAFVEDPFTANIKASSIRPTQSEEMSKKMHKIENDMDPFDNILYYDNSELKEDQKRLQETTEQLKRDLAKAHEEIDRIYSVLKNNNSTLNSATGTQIPDPFTAIQRQ